MKLLLFLDCITLGRRDYQLWHGCKISSRKNCTWVGESIINRPLDFTNLPPNINNILSTLGQYNLHPLCTDLLFLGEPINLQHIPQAMLPILSISFFLFSCTPNTNRRAKKSNSSGKPAHSTYYACHYRSNQNPWRTRTWVLLTSRRTLNRNIGPSKYHFKLPADNFKEYQNSNRKAKCILFPR